MEVDWRDVRNTLTKYELWTLLGSCMKEISSKNTFLRQLQKLEHGMNFRWYKAISKIFILNDVVVIFKIFKVLISYLYTKGEMIQYLGFVLKYSRKKYMER